MAGASPATTMIRLRKTTHAYHGRRSPIYRGTTPCGCHARWHHIFHSPTKSLLGVYFMPMLGMYTDISALLDAIVAGNTDQITAAARSLLQQGAPAAVIAGRVGMI